MSANPVPSVVAGDFLVCDLSRGAGSFDLVFADPPFNIGYKYDSYKDNRTDYHAWCQEWVDKCVVQLKPNGSLWIAINDENAAELVIACKRAGLAMRNWCVWHYTFGTHLKKKFSRCKTHLLYFVKDPEDFTFNRDAILVPSARQTKYGDKRAAGGGKTPGDVWEFSRVCGSFKERQGWHPCQMPESVLERIILACSNEGDKVLDPFAGSGTTLAVAQRLGRESVGYEISGKYAKGISERIDCSLKFHPSGIF